MNKKQFDFYAADYPFETLVSRMEAGKVILTDDTQEWTQKTINHASKVIEACLLRVPLEACYLVEDNYKSLEVISGNQTLEMIWNFFSNHFALIGLTTLTELNGKKFNQIGSYARDLENYTMRCWMFKNETDTEKLIEIISKLKTTIQTNNVSQSTDTKKEETATQTTKETINEWTENWETEKWKKEKQENEWSENWEKTVENTQEAADQIEETVSELKKEMQEVETSLNNLQENTDKAKVVSINEEAKLYSFDNEEINNTDTYQVTENTATTTQNETHRETPRLETTITETLENTTTETDVDKLKIVGGYYNSLALVCQNEKYGFTNESNNIVIDCQFDNAESFSSGLAKVEKDKKYNYIDCKGEILTDWMDDITSFYQDLATVKKDGKFNLINKEGKLITDWFDDIYSFEDGIAKVKNDNKYSFINETGKLICEFFEDAYSFRDGTARVKKDSEWFEIDKKGQKTTTNIQITV